MTSGPHFASAAIDRARDLDAMPESARPSRPPARGSTRALMEVALAVAVIAAIGVLDWLSGDEISLASLHILPVLVIAYRRGVRAGLWTVVAATATCVTVDVASGVHAHAGLIILACRTVDRTIAYGIALALVGVIRHQRDRARALAITDPLTRLSNRRNLEETLNRERRRAERRGRALALAAIDLDGFKSVNDTHGHDEGDRVLCAIADVLRATRGADFACRLGGDEFLLILSDIEAAEAAPAFARVIRDLRVAMDAGGFPITFSAGLAIFVGRMPPASTMLSRADTLMYRVKRGTKNDVCMQTFKARAHG